MAGGVVRRKPALAALVCFALALPVLFLLKANSTPHYSISHAEATRIALADQRVAQGIAGTGYTQVRVTPLDDQQQRVSIFNGPRLVLRALVGPRPEVTRIAVRTPGVPESGSTIANMPPVLIGLALLFVLAMATVPLLSLRNLDVLAFAALTLPAWLINEGFIEASVLIAYLLLAYLILRLLWAGLAGNARPARASLYWHVTANWTARERRRVLGLVLTGLAVSTTILTVTSSGASDVAFAAMAGATDLIHGTAPYGHIPDFIVHGDTYPPLTYALYVPAAIAMPVTDLFSDPQGALIVAAAAMLLVAWGLYRVVASTSEGDREGPQSEPNGISGLRAAIAWLAFPPVLLAASSGTTDIVLTVFLVAALGSLAHRRRSAMLLGVAAWVKFIPVVVLPVWLARLRGRELAEAVVGLVALSVIVLGSLVAVGGVGSIGAMAHAISFQFDRGSLSSLWLGWGFGSLQPVAQAALLAAIVAATLAVRSSDRLRDDLPRLSAILAGILLLSQFAANYWTWAYLPWAIAPALLVLVPATEALEPRAATVSTPLRGSAGPAHKLSIPVPAPELEADGFATNGKPGSYPDVPPAVDASTSALP